MFIVKFIFKLIGKVLLIPVWLLLVFMTGIVKTAVSLISVAHTLLSGIILFGLIGTIIWFRQDWMRYIIFGVAGGIIFTILFAGVLIEAAISEMCAYVGYLIIGA